MKNNKHKVTKNIYTNNITVFYQISYISYAPKLVLRFRFWSS